MDKPSSNIFLIIPNDQPRHKRMIVFADSADEARAIATAHTNPAKQKLTGENSPLIDSTYLDKSLSTCQEIHVEVILKGNNSVHFQYLGNEYHLTKNFAQALKN